MALDRATARADLRGGLAWSVFGAAIFAGAWRMDRYEAMGATLYTAPGLVPGIFGLVLVALGAALALRARRALTAASEGHAEPLINRRIALTLALTLSYAAVLMGRVPFSVATALFVAAFTWTFTDAPGALRRVLIAAAAGVLTAIVIVLVFEKVFLVRLP